MQLTQELIDSGMVIPLDDLLDKYAPNVKAAFSKEQWDMVRAAGKGKIYYLPQYGHIPGLRAGMVRKDWLKRVGIDKVPETKQEYLAMLRAFKDKDANGDGDPADEFPVSGREMLRWFDDLFVMHGVVMYEGHPQWKWNPAMKIFESQQVSDEMRDAIAFLRELYAEGLIDSVMPVQKAADWQAKVGSDKVGTYFHLLGEVSSYSRFIADKAGKDETGLSYWDVMPMPPRVEGKPQYKNVYPVVQEPIFMITKYAKDPAAIMKWFAFGSSEEGQVFKDLGIEGKDFGRDGDRYKVANALPANTFRFLMGYTNYVPDIVRSTALGPVKVAMIDKVKAAGVQDLEAYNLPVATYKGFEDYAPATAKLYREYASKMIIGTLPLSAWDAYVKEWYAKGGQVVTDRATMWYKSVKGMK
jgi:ABC-type glycerol-3-phosphate transport system substrate-binding protein